MSDCPGTLYNSEHCPNCADNEYSWLPREYSEKVRENAQLRAQLTQVREVLQAVADQDCDDWGCDPDTHPCPPRQARDLLADLPDAKRKGEP
jgi:hypothetical protein